jgi:hypothetical protein
VKQYKTNSGTYSEDELAIVVWRNPNQRKAKQARFFETMTSESSSHPMAFPIESLRNRKEWANAVYISSRDEFLDSLSGSSRSKPLVIPIPVAKNYLGWETFYIPTEYTE